MARKTISFEQLVLELFQAVEAGGNWTPFFASLTGAMDLETCTIILRAPSPGDLGELCSYGTNIALEDIYRNIEYRDDPFRDRKSTRLNSSHSSVSRMPSSA